MKKRVTSPSVVAVAGDRALRPAARARGVLRTRAPRGQVEHQRVLPCAELAATIAHFWTVRWALDEPFEAETLPHPTVHVVVEAGADPEVQIAGVPSRRFVRRLEGQGEVFGVKFRPAMFSAVLGAPLSTIADRTVAGGSVLGPAADALARAVLGAPTLAARVAGAERAMLTWVPAPAPELVLLRDLVESMEHDRALVRAEDAAARAGLDLRTLQRRFRAHVGVSPKWVIQRFRLHEAAERLEAAEAPPLAALAAELGYADQAHFARDFSRVIGRSPRRFAAIEGGVGAEE